MHKGTNYIKNSSFPSTAETGSDLSDRKTRFQAEYGVLIYNYPIRYLKLDSEKAGDFYLYAFEKDRIFKRIDNFKGKQISLANYLKYYVLKDMCLEWLRSISHRLNTESLDDPDTGLDNRLQADGDPALRESSPWMDCMMQVFKQPAFLILRILHIADHPVQPEDIRMIAEKTGREFTDVVQRIAEIENQLGDRMSSADSRSDQMAIQYWRRLTYQKKLVRIESDLQTAEHNHQTAVIEKLTHEKSELERKYTWRLRQVETMMSDASQAVTTSYKDIAELMMTTTGAVSAKIYKTKARLKSEIIRICGKKAEC